MRLTPILHDSVSPEVVQLVTLLLFAVVRRVRIEGMEREYVATILAQSTEYLQHDDPMVNAAFELRAREIIEMVYSEVLQ